MSATFKEYKQLELPAIAEVNLDVDAQSTQYGWFYALFGAGALVGAISSSTVFLRARRAVMLRTGFGGFAAALTWLALLRDIRVAYVAIAVLGFFLWLTAAVVGLRGEDTPRWRALGLSALGLVAFLVGVASA